MNTSRFNVAIVGATGVVGRELLSLLEKRNFPIDTLKCFASPLSVGQKLPYNGTLVEIQALDLSAFDDVDIAFFCAGSAISRQYIPQLLEKDLCIIDSSSLYRKDPSVPLVVPEINGHLITASTKLVSSPNCTTSIMLMPLFPLHKEFKIKRIQVATYQAASGGGAKLMSHLIQETQGVLSQDERKTSFLPFPYAFNLYLHNTKHDEEGYSEEENKVLFETRKILNDDTLEISATCVRVPVLRAHSEAIFVEFHEKVSKEKAYTLLRNTPGVKVVEDYSSLTFPMPSLAEGQEDVLCGRIREDRFSPYALNLWVVGDQLLKGAALNSVQIAETFAKQKQGGTYDEKQKTLYIAHR